ncbi:hypothetical protein F4604DRAFT_1688201 [Suillus subluteus]|nr:hypothetical protein F4604DRAFT_1688201 [Suillus subluteus]
MTFEDYARILAHPRKPSVSSGIQLQSNCALDTSNTDNDAPVMDSHMDEDDDMDGGGNNDALTITVTKTMNMKMRIMMTQYMQRLLQADSCHHEDNIEGDSNNNNDTKDADEEPEGGENNKDLKTSPARRLQPQRVKKAIYNFDDGSQTSSSDSSYTSSQANESDADENLNHDSPSSLPTKRRKTSSAVKTTSANTSQNTTCLTTIHAHASISHLNDNPTPASIVLGPTPDIDATIIDWKECQHKHYHVMGKESEQWDTIHNYNVTGSNTNQSHAKTILSMREDIARKLSAYSRLKGGEAIGCIFDTTQDEAAQ